jgi:acetyltransferase
MASSLDAFFNPRSIVVIGASRDPQKLGYGIAHNLVRCGYQGAIHFVNPKGGTLFERPLLTSIQQVPDQTDLAVLLVPAPAVPATLESCGERGIKAAVIASGGFREVGPEGLRLEESCLAIARRFDMRLMGPNCIGLLDSNLPLDTTFLPSPTPPPGDIAFISHSGAICAAIIDWSSNQGFNFSRLVSLGNQVDVTETEILAPVAADDHTKVLALYLEAINDGSRFVQEAQKVSRCKPLVALKVGRTHGGKKAAASHTGALAGEEVAYNAAFRRAGVQRAETAQQMFDWARALAWSPALRGDQIAVLTNAGGPGVMAADAVEANGLHLASLAAYTTESLCEMLAAAASVENPVDMLASASPEQYATALRLLLDDAHVHGVLLILPPPPMFTALAVAHEIIPIIQGAEKPVLVALMGHDLILEAREAFRAAQIPAYPFPETAASALAALGQRWQILAHKEEVITPSGVNAERARELLAALKPGWLSPYQVRELLHAYGIPAPAVAFARSTAEVGVKAARLGFPVVMKINAPDILHKSDLGGIALNLDSVQAVRQSYTEMIARVHDLAPQAQINGVQLQPMISGGQEVIAGVTRDPQFGPLVMFGSGGVEVEGLRDIAFELAPLTLAVARRLLEETWAGKKLAGFRHLPAVDEQALLDILIRLGQMAADHPRLAEIEINPLIVLAEGATAVDVRARLA